jgi:NAD(P)-dependent dehydrogenase (short-subunit alcohol dehydrogenase family)
MDMPQNAVIGTRRFTEADQRMFAALSGDHNPMHMDAVAARRTQAAEPAVHGVHALLWGLDLAASQDDLRDLQHIRVQFSHFIHLQPLVTARYTRGAASSARLDMSIDELPVMTVLLRFGPPAFTGEVPHTTVFPASTLADDRTLAQMEGCSGWLAPPLPAEDFARAFPNAAAALHPRRLSGLAQTSRLVGMICPGLHSIYAGLIVQVTDTLPEREGISFHTTRTDERFRRVDMQATGDGLTAQIRSFARHPPVQPPDLRTIAGFVRPGAYAGAIALVVGGSRGIGAITAQVIAVGGGQVVVTYAQGRADAEALRDGINAAYGAQACSTMKLDVTLPVAPQLEGLAGRVSHVYFFATPHIAAQRPAPFTPSLLASFMRFYVEAFHETCIALLRDRLTVFYPSSVFVEERPKGMTEYSMAKLAGEMLCAAMAGDHAGLRILAPRLPRVLTDQTAAVTALDNADPLQVMLPLIAQVQAAQGLGN